MENYSLQLIWSDEDQGYVATVPEIPLLRIIAKTAEHALSGINTAISAYLLEKKADRGQVPLPRRLEEYSGQFRLRLPRALHATLVTEAADEGVSLNTYIMYLLSHRHIQEKTLKETTIAYGEEIRDTMQIMHELVSSVTVTSPETPTFPWRNDSSATIMQIQ